MQNMRVGGGGNVRIMHKKNLNHKKICRKVKTYFKKNCNFLKIFFAQQKHKKNKKKLQKLACTSLLFLANKLFFINNSINMSF